MFLAEIEKLRNKQNNLEVGNIKGYLRFSFKTVFYRNAVFYHILIKTVIRINKRI